MAGKLNVPVKGVMYTNERFLARNEDRILF